MLAMLAKQKTTTLAMAATIRLSIKYMVWK